MHTLDHPDRAAPPAGPPPPGGLKAGHGTDQQLSTLFEIARILATKNDLDAIVSRVLTCLTDSMGGPDAGILMLHDAKEGYLKAKAAQGYDMAVLAEMRIAPGESIVGHAYEAGRAELYPTPESAAAAMVNLSPANATLLRAAARERREPLSIICLPLATNSSRIGALLLENMNPQAPFTMEDLEFLRPVADLVALSIENTRLASELEAARSLNEANRLKAEVISTLAHEMRTPLTSIKGYATTLLLEEAGFSVATQREFLQIIDEECDVLQDLIHDLLESSIIDAGFLKLEPQPVMLPRLAKAAIDEVAHLSRRHHFMVDFPSPFPIVDADPQRITQVLRNLFDNAVKYSPGGGLIVVRGEAREDEVMISVADQGEGIAPEHINRLFEKFFRIKSGLGRHVVGTGLGLPIAHTIIESHGGRIWAESQIGQGTTFYFTLPRRGVDEWAAPGEETHE